MVVRHRHKAMGASPALRAGDRAYRSNTTARRHLAAGFRYFRFNPLRG
jgi:hypothetical protein